MSIGRKIAQMRTNLAAALGYTPVNKAGDTMSGRLGISGLNGLDVGAHIGFNRDQRDGSAIVAGEYRFQMSRYNGAHLTPNSLAIEAYDSSGANRGTPFIIRAGIGSSSFVSLNLQPGFGSFRSGPNTDGFAVGYTAMNGAYNTGNYFNASTGIFTAPVDGKYLVSYIFCRDTATEGRGILRLYINSVSYAEIAECWGQYQDVGGAAMVNIAANDQLRLGMEVYGSQHAAVFSVQLIG